MGNKFLLYVTICCMYCAVLAQGKGENKTEPPTENPPKPEGAKPQDAGSEKTNKTEANQVRRALVVAIVEKIVKDISEETVRIAKSSEPLNETEINKRLKAAAYKSVKETIRNDLQQLTKVDDDPKVTAKIIHTKLQSELKEMSKQLDTNQLAFRALGAGRKAAADLASKFMRSVLMG